MVNGAYMRYFHRLAQGVMSEAPTDQDALEEESEKAKTRATLTRALSILRPYITPRPSRPPRAPASTKSLPSPASHAHPCTFTKLDTAALRENATSLEDLAASIEPFINEFDNIFTFLGEQGGGDLYGTMNGVQILGLKGDMLMSIEPNAPSAIGPDNTDSWSELFRVPEPANLNEGKVLIFTHASSFYFATGRKVWCKKIAKAKTAPPGIPFQHWKDCYEPGWEYLGDAALPGDIKAVIPLIFDDDATGTVSLAALTENGKIQKMVGDEIDTSTMFTDMKCTSDAYPSSYNHIAFFQGNIIAIDDASQTWHLTPAADGTYTANCQLGVATATRDIVGTEKDLVALRADGQLYRCIPQIMPLDQNDILDSARNLAWTPWIAATDITHIGAARVGITMNLRQLTLALKQRYIQGQASLYPVVNTLKTFASAHMNYLQDLHKASGLWEAASGADKDAIALRAGRKYLAHANGWSREVNRSIQQCGTQVISMQKQLNHVREALSVQANDIQSLLEEARALLGSDEKEKETTAVSAEKWCGRTWKSMGTSITCSILLFLATAVLRVESILVTTITTVEVAGIAGAGVSATVGADVARAAMGGIIGGMGGGVVTITVGGVIAGVAIASGVLAVGAAITAGVKLYSLSLSNATITKQRLKVSEISGRNGEFNTICGMFDNVGELYENLNAFWTGMYDNSQGLATLDDMTIKSIGEGELAYEHHVQSSLDATKEMADACKSYLTTLNKQGIRRRL